MSETNPNANLTGYTCIGSTAMDVTPLDAAPDTWTPTTTTDAPSARDLHTAVWTGSEMIVWGGSSTTRLNTGGRYDPATDAWTATTTTGAPTARASHTAVWTGSEMIVWGGDSGGSTLNTGGRLGPAAIPTTMYLFRKD